MTPNRRTCLSWIVGGIAATAIVPAESSAQTNKKRKIIAPKKRILVYESEPVELRWTTDEPVKLHLHGYDREILVEPGKVFVMPFTGRATGRFPITSHGWGTGGHGHHALSYLEVYPR